MTTEQQAEQTNSGSTMEVAAYSVGGGVAGAVTSTMVGKMGLATVGGTVIGLGLLPVIGAGVVTGLAVYGLKRAIFS